MFTQQSKKILLTSPTKVLHTFHNTVSTVRSLFFLLFLSFFLSLFLSFSLSFVEITFSLDTDWIPTDSQRIVTPGCASIFSMFLEQRQNNSNDARTRILFVFMARVRFANVLEVSSQPWHARLLRVTSNSTMFLQIFPSENSKIGDGRFRYTDGYDSEIIWKQFELFARKTNSLIEFSTMTRWLTIFQTIYNVNTSSKWININLNRIY